MKTYKFFFVHIFKGWFDVIKRYYISLVILFILLATTYWFYQTCNEIKLRKVEVSISKKYFQNQLDYCSIKIVSDYSGSMSLEDNFVSSKDGHAVFIQTDNDSITKYQDVKVKNLLVDSVWGYIDIKTKATLLMPKILIFKTNNNIPIINKKEKCVVFSDEIETVKEKNKNDYISITRNQFYFRAKRERSEYLKKDIGSSIGFSYSCSSYKGQSFFSLRNVAVSCIHLNVTGLDAKENCINIDYKGPMNFMNIYPEPDERSASKISYSDMKKIQYIEENGLYVYAESVANKSLQDTRNFVIATVIGFLFSYIINLLIKIFQIKYKRKISI